MKGSHRGERNVDRGPCKGERGRRGTLEGRNGKWVKGWAYRGPTGRPSGSQ